MGVIKKMFRIPQITLSYRCPVKAAERKIVNSPLIAYEIFMAEWDKNKLELLEEFKILLLDRRSACIGITDISTGGISSCVVDPKIVFAAALRSRASAIIMAHNHPSGNLKPSIADETLTLKFKKAGELLDIGVSDHLIVTTDGYYSFANEGFL